MGKKLESEACIQDERGKLLRHRNAISEKWKVHLLTFQNVISATIDPTVIESITLFSKIRVVWGGAPSLDEAKQTLRDTADGKATGPDVPPAEFLKLGLVEEPSDILYHVESMIVAVWTCIEEPQELDGATSNVPDKKDRDEYCGYRDISFVAHASQVLRKAVATRFRGFRSCTEVGNSSEEQCGFGRQQPSTDVIFVPRQQKLGRVSNTPVKRCHRPAEDARLRRPHALLASILPVSGSRRG